MDAISPDAKGQLCSNLVSLSVESGKRSVELAIPPDM